MYSTLTTLKKSYIFDPFRSLDCPFLCLPRANLFLDFWVGESIDRMLLCRGLLWEPSHNCLGLLFEFLGFSKSWTEIRALLYILLGIKTFLLQIIFLEANVALPRSWI